MARKKSEFTKEELAALRAPGAKFVADAMVRLGHDWGLDRPLTNSEMGRALKLSEETWPGSHISKLIHGKTMLSGPIEVAIDLMLKGGVPMTAENIARPGYPRIRAA